MIFAKQSQKILNEWVQDFDSAPISPQNNDLIAALKHGASGGECKTTFVSSIVTQAFGNLQFVDMPDFIAESRIIINNIKNHFTVEQSNGFVTVGKK